MKAKDIDDVGAVGTARFRVDEDVFTQWPTLVGKRDFKALIPLKVISLRRVEVSDIQIAVRKTDPRCMIGIVRDRPFNAVDPSRGDGKARLGFKTATPQGPKDSDFTASLEGEHRSVGDVIDSKNRNPSQKVPAVLKYTESKVTPE